MSHSSRVYESIIILALSFQLVSCGTILYPERRGQMAGRLDVGVVLLDSVGLLFFLIPGIIAFAVDFSSGAIYLPAGSTASFNPDDYTVTELENIVRRETGKNFAFNDKRIQVTKLENLEEIPVYFAQFQKTASAQLAKNSTKN